MAYWGGATAGGWSHSHFPSGKRGLKRSVDGWDDEELGKLYDHSVMKRMLPYLKPYRKRLIFALLGMLLFAAASMTQPYLIGLAIDRFVRTGDLNGLNLIGGALIGLAILAWAGQWTQQLLRKSGLYRQIYDLELRDQEEALPGPPGEQAPAATEAPAPAAGS